MYYSIFTLYLTSFSLSAQLLCELVTPNTAIWGYLDNTSGWRQSSSWLLPSITCSLLPQMSSHSSKTTRSQRSLLLCILSLSKHLNKLSAIFKRGGKKMLMVLRLHHHWLIKSQVTTKRTPGSF